ncbi:hypothetical protein [Flavitalea sp.]|nr:hypothetical protein [Flavitalea sp.]
MSFKGTLDFQHVVQFDTEEMRVYYGYESNEVFVLPDSLGIAVNGSGKPDFSITLVKAMHDLSPVSLYGTLDLQLSLNYPLEKAVSTMRLGGYTTSVIPATCSGGYLSLVPVNNTLEFPSELQSTISSNWNPVGPTKYLFRLEATTASLMKESLRNGSLLFKAIALLECKGLSPRLPLLVGFSPAEVLNQLHASVADANGAVDPNEVRMFFNRDASLLPITITGDRKDEIPGLFAEAISDRILKRFGKPAFPTDKSDKDLVQLGTSVEAGTGLFEWDLSEVIEVKRLVRVNLNPAEAVQLLSNQEGGIESSIKETLVPRLQTGFKYLNVSAILPDHRPNVLKAGVQIDVPPNVPLRMQAISETVNFAAPGDSSDIVLRYSPVETLNYNYRPFMLVQSINGVRKIAGSPGTANKARLLLNSDHFKAKIITIQAASDLLEIASLNVVFGDETSIATMAYTIDNTNPILSVCIPEDEALPGMQISAISITSGAIASLPDQPAVSMRVGLHHFKEYGFHSVKVCCNFSNGSSPVKIELMPDGTTDDLQPTLLFFTPTGNCKDFGYFTESPFLYTYKYRFKKDDNTNGEWFPMQSPWVPLILDNSLI